MRTYRAKKPVYEEVNNVNELCRLCLEKVVDGIPIFKNDQDMCTALAMRVMICVGLEMKHDKCLPNMICTYCQEKLDNCYKFRRKCEVSYHKLKNHLVALQINYQCNVDKEFNVEYSQIVQPPCEIEEGNLRIVQNQDEDIKHLVCSREIQEKEEKNLKQCSIHRIDETNIEDITHLTIPVPIVDNNKEIVQRIEKPILENKIQITEIYRVVNKKEIENKMDQSSSSNHQSIENNQSIDQSSSLCLFEDTKQPDEHGIEKTEKEYENQILLPIEFVGKTPKEEESKQNEQSLVKKKSQIRKIINQHSQKIQLERKENETQLQPYNEIVDMRQQDVQIIEKSEKEDDKMLLLQCAEQTSNVSEKYIEMQVGMHMETNPDIGTFLAGILTQLGVVRTHAGGDGERLELVQDISTFELETGDGQHLMLQLMEEDDDTPENAQSPPQVLDMETKKDLSTAVNVNSKLGTQAKETTKSRAWCAVCGRTFAHGSSARRHARLHSGARPHVCHCGAAFPLKADLDRHKLVHLAVKPHRCSQCSKSFTQEGALRAHVRSHAARASRSLALHPCTLCDKVFLYVSGLSRHMVTHTGRVFTCSFCDKRFNDRSSLVRHLRNFHEASYVGAGARTNRIHTYTK